MTAPEVAKSRVSSRLPALRGGMTAGKGGFTLIELMVVVIIIAALASMVLPRVLPVADEAKSKIAQGDIASLSTALKLYYLRKRAGKSARVKGKGRAVAKAGAENANGAAEAGAES